MDEKEKRAEKLDMVKFFYMEWEYRNKTYWMLLYKTIFAIISIMSLPYFLAQANSLLSLLWLFPVVGILLCLFSLLILDGESSRMIAVRERMNRILFSIDDAYQECPLKNGIFRKAQRLYMSKLVLLSYFGLILAFAAQLIFILSNSFVVSAVS